MADTLTAPPVAPKTETAPPDLAPKTGAQTLQQAIRAFGEKYTTVADDDPRMATTGGEPPPESLTEAAEGADTGAAHDEAAPSASGPVLGEDGRWRNPDGSFAKDPNAPETERQPDAAAVEESAPGDEIETVPFVLKGLTANGEQDEEIDVPKALEERFRRLTNDANRYRETVKRLDAIEAKEADFRILEARMRTAPDAWVLSRLPAETQTQLAVQLVAQHWDAIVGKLAEFADHPEQRQLAAKDNEIRQVRAQQDWVRQEAEAKAETQALRLIEDTIPDGTSETRANRFRTLAESEMKRFYQTHNRTLPTVSEMQAIFVEVAHDMGLAEPTRTAASPTAIAPSTRPAAPQAPKAQGTVRKPTMTAAERQAAVQRSRVVARRIAPAGAGGEPSAAPAIPPTSSTDKSRNPIKERIAFLRANPGSLRATE